MQQNDDRDYSKREQQARHHLHRAVQALRGIDPCADQLALQEHFTRRLDTRLGNQHITGAGDQEVRHIKASGAPQERRNALLEQQALDEFRLALVVCAEDLDELTFGVLGLDLPRPQLGLTERGL